MICVTTKEIYECKSKAAKENNIPYKKFIRLLNDNLPDDNGNYYKVLNPKKSNIDMKTKRSGGNNPAARKVSCNGRVYNTLIEAAASEGLSTQCIRKHIKNEIPDKLGNIWRYEDGTV